MKCTHVESIIVEYAEGALCVADELCVDIHLVQCESCRAELLGVAQLESAAAASLDIVEAPPDVLALLGCLDSLPDKPPRRNVFSVRHAGISMLRGAVIAAFVALALMTGAATWEREAPRFFSLPSVDAAADRSLIEALRPLADPAELKELRDLGEMTGIGPVPHSPA